MSWNRLLKGCRLGEDEHLREILVHLIVELKRGIQLEDITIGIVQCLIGDVHQLIDMDKEMLTELEKSTTTVMIQMAVKKDPIHAHVIGSNTKENPCMREIKNHQRTEIRLIAGCISNQRLINRGGRKL